MYTVIVTTVVRADKLAPFIEGIHTNAISSMRDEPGCLRFDVHQSAADPTHFLFYEIYRDRDAFEIEHKAAPHYADWRKVFDDCVIAAQHQNSFYVPLFPDDLPERPQP